MRKQILLILLFIFVTKCSSVKIGKCVFGKLILGDVAQSSVRGVITFVEMEVVLGNLLFL